MTIASWHVGRALDVADPPFMTELFKFSILEELRPAISVDDLWNAKMCNECDCLINNLFCSTSFSSFIDAGVAAELAC